MHQERAQSWYSTLIAVTIVVLVFGVMYAYNLDGWLIDDDEGTYLYQSWRMTEGDRPYEDMFNTRWPLFLYTGAGWMQLVGAEVLPMRLLSVLLTLGTATLVFLAARETGSPQAALLSMVVLLLHPEVFTFGRSFRPEPFYVFLATMGLYLFVRGQRREKKGWLLGSGAVLAAATLYKPLAILVLGGCALFLVATWVREPQGRMTTTSMAITLVCPYVVLLSVAISIFVLRFPGFTDGVFRFHLVNGHNSEALRAPLRGIVFLAAYWVAFAPFLIITLPGVLRGWTQDHGTAIVSWQVPTALAFLVLSRDLFPRLLLYLVPSLSILFASALEPIRLGLRRLPLYLAILSAVIVPWVVDDTIMIMRNEEDTLEISRTIQALTAPDAFVLSDYQALNFHARRPSTYSGAELSGFYAASGQVTGEDLMREMEDTNTQVVVVDVSPDTAHHMIRLRDYEDLRAFLEERFRLLDVVPRGDQLLEIHVRGTANGESRRRTQEGQTSNGGPPKPLSTPGS